MNMRGLPDGMIRNMLVVGIDGKSKSIVMNRKLYERAVSVTFCFVVHDGFSATLWQ